MRLDSHAPLSAVGGKLVAWPAAFDVEEHERPGGDEAPPGAHGAGNRLHIEPADLRIRAVLRQALAPLSVRAPVGLGDAAHAVPHVQDLEPDQLLGHLVAGVAEDHDGVVEGPASVSKASSEGMSVAKRGVPSLNSAAHYHCVGWAMTAQHPIPRRRASISKTGSRE